MHKILLRTKVGSHMWNMARPDSDTDYFTIYQNPTRDILRGDGATRIIHTRQICKDTDESKFEIFHVIDRLISGNVNFLQGVLSSHVVEIDKHGFIDELRRIVISNPSRAPYKSVQGVGQSMKRDHLKGKPITPKRSGQVLRVLNFGINLLNTGNYIFNPVTNATIDDVLIAMNDLDIAYSRSTLPETTNEEPFRAWLLRIRLHDLRE